MNTMTQPTRNAVRSLLVAVLAIDSDLDAFCGDFFSQTAAKFSNGMDRTAKINMLLEQEELLEIVARVENFDSKRFDRHKHLLNELNPRDKSQNGDIAISRWGEIKTLLSGAFLFDLSRRLWSGFVSLFGGSQASAVGVPLAAAAVISTTIIIGTSILAPSRLLQAKQQPRTIGADPVRTTGVDPVQTTGAEPVRTTGADPVRTPVAPTGRLVIHSNCPVYFQVGKRPWSLSPATVDVPFGHLTITTLSGEQEVTMSPGGEPFKIEIAESPAENDLRSGISLAKAHDTKNALIRLHRARVDCMKGHKRNLDYPCGNIGLDAYYQIGRLHENANAYHLAIDAYQTAFGLGERITGRSELKEQINEAIARLRPKVGQVIVRSMVKGKCQSRISWLPRGSYYVRGEQSKSYSVVLRGGDVQEVGTCNGGS